MANLAIDDQDRGDVAEAEIVARLLLRPRQQPSESIEPTVRDLDHPAAGRMAIGVAWRRQWGGRARLGRDVRRVPAGGRRLAAGGVVIAAVEREMRWGRRGRFDHRRIEQRRQLGHVGPIGSRHDEGDRQAFGFGQQVPFGAGFAAIGRIAPRGLRRARPPFLPKGALTMHPSAACQVQSSPTAPSYSRSRTAQARSSAPFATHSLKRSCTVDFGPNSRGNGDHCAPVRASQISPSKIARSARRGRPGFLRGLSLRSTGSSRAHNSSSTRQSVGASFVVAAAAARCEVSMPRDYH